MTKILKLEAKGFKSFADKTELVFGDTFNVILGPNGSGKCVTKDTDVYLANGSMVKIGDLVNEKIKQNKYAVVDDGYIIEGDDTEIICFDKDTLKLKPKKIQAFVKRTSPENLVHLKTRTGRTITSTTYHPLFSVENDRIKSVKAEELKKGMRIAVPRFLPEVESLDFYDLIDNIHLEDKLYVPHTINLKEYIFSQGSVSELSTIIDIPKIILKGFKDGQSINFYYVIKILRHFGWNNKKIAEHVPEVKGITSKNSCRIPWKNSPEFSRLLGYLLAEGRLSDSNQIWFTNSCEEVVRDYYAIMVSLFGVHTTINEYKTGCYDVISYSKPLQIILSKFGFGFGGTIKKNIENIYLKNTTKECIGHLCNGLYSGDGYVSNKSVEIVSKSKELSTAIQILLSRLGIVSHTKEIFKIATNTGFQGKYFQITFYGGLNFKLFSDYVDLIHPQKQKRLSNLLSKNINPNCDLIEINSLIKEVTVDLGINVKKTKKTFPKLDAYCYNQCTPSVNGAQQLMNDLFTPVAIQSGNQNLISLQKLEVMLNSDIYWDEVVEIETFSSEEEWVYDLTVEDDHNFVANNIIIHNSNVFDALCFVLGKSGAKGLRAEKSANLIYNGGKSKQPAKHGEVSIFLDNAERSFPLDDKVVKVTRMIKPNGQSVYKINDEKHTREQIIELLGSAGIDPNGYNIILQGDIVRLVEMSPNERRGIIEEIAGISVYEEKKSKASKELDKIENNLNEAEIILSERQVYLKELKKERDQAISFKELNEQLKSIKATLIHLDVEERNEKIEGFKKSSSSYQEKIDAIQKEIDELKQKVIEYKQEIQSINKEVEEKGEKNQVALHKEVEQIKVDIATQQANVDGYNNELSRIKEQKSKLQTSLKEIEEKSSSYDKEIKQLEKDLQLNQKMKGEIQAKIDVFRKKNNLDNASEIDQQIDEFDKKSEELEKEMYEIRSKQQDLIREKDRLEMQINNADEKINKVLEVSKENAKEIEKLKDMKKNFKQATVDLQKCLTQDQSYVSQIKTANGKLATANEELAKLRVRQASIHERVGSNNAIKEIIKNKSKFDGVYGTVAELGNVDAKYSLALDTAAGNRLNSIVVKDDKTAAECIRYLREQRLGIATFLPLNKIKGASKTNLPSARGVVGSAIDLIKYDAKFKPIFQYVFGSTLVVESIDVARRIGIGTCKMVTLEGDLAEASGAMKGGFSKRRPGSGFQESKVNENLEKYEKQVQDAQMLLSRIENERSENQDLIDRLREHKATLEGEIIKKEKSLHLESDDLEISQKLKKEFKEKLSEVDKQLDDINMVVSTKNRELATLKIERQKLKSQIMDIRNPTKLAELNTFQQKLDDLKSEFIRKESEKKAKESQKDDSFLKDIENLNEQIAESVKEEESMATKISEVKEKVTQMKTILKEKEALEKEFYEKFRELFKKRDAAQKNLEKEEEKIIKKEDGIREIEHKNTALSLELARYQAELNAFEEEMKQYEGVELLDQRNKDTLKKDAWSIDQKLSRIGNVNMKALEVYDRVEEEFNKLLSKKEILIGEREKILLMINEIDAKKQELFLKVFDVINQNFQKIFQLLSTKGQAEMELENPKSPFEGGVYIKVRLKGKKFMDIRSLSGGEKTLTALAFIFAVQEHNPAPFYIFDEVDAALDKRNSEKLASLVHSYCERAQYVVVSHNDGVISSADTLYGVSMNEDGKSKVVSLKI